METPLICSHALHAVRQVIRQLPSVREPDDRCQRAWRPLLESLKTVVREPEDRSQKYRKIIYFHFNTFRGSTDNCIGSFSCISNNDGGALTTLTDAWNEKYIDMFLFLSS